MNSFDFIDDDASILFDDAVRSAFDFETDIVIYLLMFKRCV